LSATKNSDAVPSHVLVVDDYDDGREMYAEFLELAGYRVSQAKDGAEALRKANDLLPDIILMDLSLPDIDGSDVARRLRKDPRTRQIPLVVVTGHAPENVQGHTHYDGFVIKPCPPDALVEEVARLLAMRKSSGPARQE
jgi:two-component system, cell cycle response regulator DivK